MQKRSRASEALALKGKGLTYPAIGARMGITGTRRHVCAVVSGLIYRARNPKPPRRSYATAEPSELSLVAAALVSEGASVRAVADELGMEYWQVWHAVRQSRWREAAEEAPPHFASAWGAHRDAPDL